MEQINEYDVIGAAIEQLKAVNHKPEFAIVVEPYSKHRDRRTKGFRKQRTFRAIAKMISIQ